MRLPVGSTNETSANAIPEASIPELLIKILYPEHECIMVATEYVANARSIRVKIMLKLEELNINSIWVIADVDIRIKGIS